MNIITHIINYCGPLKIIEFSLNPDYNYIYKMLIIKHISF